MIGLTLIGLALAAELPAEHAGMDHGQMANAPADPAADPQEPGQSAYAAIGEIVRILVSDPKTDWAKVDVDRLRQHLVDMDAVTLRSRVQTTRLRNGAQFVVTGPPEVADGIKRMVSAHFSEPDVGAGWSFNTSPRADGAVVTVTSADPAQAARIAALGFYGVLTMGDHHQPHHLMMARGGMQH